MEKTQDPNLVNIWPECELIGRLLGEFKLDRNLWVATEGAFTAVYRPSNNELTLSVHGDWGDVYYTNILRIQFPIPVRSESGGRRITIKAKKHNITLLRREDSTLKLGISL